MNDYLINGFVDELEKISQAQRKVKTKGFLGLGGPDFTPEQLRELKKAARKGEKTGKGLQRRTFGTLVGIMPGAILKRPGIAALGGLAGLIGGGISAK